MICWPAITRNTKSDNNSCKAAAAALNFAARSHDLSKWEEVGGWEYNFYPAQNAAYAGAVYAENRMQLLHRSLPATLNAGFST